MKFQNLKRNRMILGFVQWTRGDGPGRIEERRRKTKLKRGEKRNEGEKDNGRDWWTPFSRSLSTFSFSFPFPPWSELQFGARYRNKCLEEYKNKPGGVRDKASRRGVRTVEGGGRSYVLIFYVRFKPLMSVWNSLGSGWSSSRHLDPDRRNNRAIGPQPSNLLWRDYTGPRTHFYHIPHS